MAALHPFRALRPIPQVAAAVAAVPYDVVSTEEARALATGNPLSFLHVSRAEIDLPPGVDPHAEVVYTTAAANFEALKARAPLVLEDEPSLYVYRLRMGRHEQTGIAGCFSMEEYERGVIKKHEHTRPDKEDDRTRHMLALRAQTGPVFLTYRSRSAVNALVEEVTAASPLFDVTAPDGVAHAIWRVDAPGRLAEAFDEVGALYIADGHHRAASAARARETLGGPSRVPGDWDTFLGVAFPHDQVQILSYNRVVTTTGSGTPETVLQALRDRFIVRDGPATPVRPGDVAVFVNGGWYNMSLGAPPDHLSPADRLDVSRLQELVLGPLLGISDPRSDTRLAFVGGARGTEELERLVRSGQAALAFSLYPVVLSDLMEVCDAGGIMPPKSTWFEPKLRDGFLSHVI